MKGKQVIILLVAGLVLGGIGWYLYTSRGNQWASPKDALGEEIFSGVPIAQTAKVRLRTPEDELELVLKDERWRVADRWDYPADFDRIRSLVRKLEELEAVREIPAGPSALGRLQLLAPEEGEEGKAGDAIELLDGEEKLLGGLLVGKEVVQESSGNSPFGGGGSFPVARYVKRLQGNEVYLVSETFSQLQASPEQWLDKEFFKLQKVASVQVAYPNETNSWSIRRETEGGDWEMAQVPEGREFDRSKASSLNTLLSSPSFTDVLNPEAAPEEVGLEEPIIARIDTFDGFHYTLRIGQATANDSYPLQVSVSADFVREREPAEEEKEEDKARLEEEFEQKVKELEEKLEREQRLEKWTYLVSKWTVDPLLKEKSHFIKEPEAAEDASGAETDPAAGGVQNENPFEFDVLNPADPPEPPLLPGQLPPAADPVEVDLPEPAEERSEPDEEN